MHKALFLAFASLAVACNDDTSAGTDAVDTSGEASETAGETEDLTGRSVYHLEFTLDGNPVVVDRELTGKDQYFAFGSTHIAPAVSFAVMDQMTFPRTLNIIFNFGIVVASDALPVQTTGTGTYAFQASPPDIEVVVKGLEYHSTEAGAAGSIVIDAWSVTTGDVVSGTFSGTLVAEGGTGASIDVAGSFHFILPAKNEGQPQ